jgi:ankyrin repeat protein
MKQADKKLRYGILNNKINSVKEALTDKADPNLMLLRDKKYKTKPILFVAIEHDNPALVELLVENGANVNNYSYITGDTPLHRLIENRNPSKNTYEIFTYLLDHGANPYFINRDFHIHSFARAKVMKFKFNTKFYDLIETFEDNNLNIMEAYKNEADKKGKKYVDNLKKPPKVESKYTQKELVELIKDEKKKEEIEKKKFIKNVKKLYKEKKKESKKKNLSTKKEDEEFKVMNQKELEEEFTFLKNKKKSKTEKESFQKILKDIRKKSKKNVKKTSSSTKNIYSPISNFSMPSSVKKYRKNTRSIRRSSKKTARSSKKTSRRSSKKTSRRSSKKTARRSSKKTARRASKKSSRRSSKRKVRRSSKKINNSIFNNMGYNIVI